jgi:DNA-binding transcriptional LysR family regulator
MRDGPDWPAGGWPAIADHGLIGDLRTCAPVGEVTRVDEVIQFVRKNPGVALLPESVARSRAVDGADMHRQVHLATLRRYLRSAACQAFVQCVFEHVG